MNRLALFLSMTLAFCLGTINGFSQEVTPLSSLSDRRASLPRYNFWVNGLVGAKGGSFKTKGAASTDDSWDEVEWGGSLSFDYCCYRRDISFWGDITPLSFYLGGGVGYNARRLSDYDALSGIVRMKPRYVGAEATATVAFTAGEGSSSFLELGWKSDFLVGASFEYEGRGLVGMGADCFTPVLNSITFQYGVIISRIRLGWRVEWNVNPIISPSAMEYYTGAAYTAETGRYFNTLYISFLLGGTDR